jgi:hypothetical protein
MSAFQSLSGEKLTLNKWHPTRWIYEYTSRWLRPQGDRVDRAGAEFGKWKAPRGRLASLFMVILILATQRPEDQLAQLHDQLNLELAMLSEQKTAKVIELLEEFRRDNPLIQNRVDQEAEAMAKPADPKTVLEAIKETDAEARDIRNG